MQPAYLLPLAAILLSIGDVSATSSAADKLKILCDDPINGQVEFHGPNSVKQLIKEYNEAKPDCLEPYDEAMNALGDILNDEDRVMNDVCSPYAYDLIRDFHQRFISIYVPEMSSEELAEKVKNGVPIVSNPRAYNKAYQPIPGALRKFFIVFVKQINATCKRRLVEKLPELVRANVNASDFEEIKRAKDESAKILMSTMSRDRLFGRSKKVFKDVQILDMHKYAGLDPLDNKLYLQVRFNNRLVRIHDACVKKFKPIYDELFTPVVKLNNLGYFDRINTKHENEELEFNSDFTRWYSIIEACELFNDVEVMQDSSALSAMADYMRGFAPQVGSKQDNEIKVYTRAEADRMKERIADNIKEHGSMKAYDPSQAQIEHDKVKFAARIWLGNYAKDGDAEVRDVERRLAKYLSKRTSRFDSLKNSSIVWLKYVFKKNKVAFQTRDDSNTVGKLAIFFDRHKTQMRIASIIVVVVFIAAHCG